jgi:hypothetical protein
MNVFLPKIQRGAIFVAKNKLQCSNENLIHYGTGITGMVTVKRLARYPAEYLAISSIRNPVGYRQSNPVYDRIPILKKAGLSGQSNIRCIPNKKMDQAFKSTLG